MEQKEILIRSTLDGSKQPSLFYKAEGNEPRPLLVGLHTWSFDRFNQIRSLVPIAQELGFHLLLPEFRGPNLVKNPHATEACGSLLAKQDIKDAIDKVLENPNVDRNNVFLCGNSGGGHMALLMAGFCPEYFRAIASFVPITDLIRWKDENLSYRESILHCCSDSEEEMYDRSPVKYMDTIAKANVKIFHGKYDNSVPVTQSIRFYNEIFEKYPQAKVYLDIFDGGHEFNAQLAKYWILSQYLKTELTAVTG